MNVNDKIIKWADDKGILSNSTSVSQLNKLMEEVGELVEELVEGNIDNAMMELGDVLVVCTVIAELMGTSTEECLQLAYDKISKRKGKMIKGVFVKDD